MEPCFFRSEFFKTCHFPLSNHLMSLSHCDHLPKYLKCYLRKYTKKNGVFIQGIFEVRSMIKKMIKHGWVTTKTLIKIRWNGQQFIGFEIEDGRILTYSKCTTDMKMHLAEKGFIHKASITFGKGYVKSLITQTSIGKSIL
jgi:hypothetical protein